MAQILSGKEVVAAIKEKMLADVAELNAKGITPTLGIIRVGERGDDIMYEKGATTRCKSVGVAVKNYLLSETVTQDELLAVIDEVNKDKSVHGVLLFRPLPKHIDDETVRNALAAEKDVDGITDLSMAGVFTLADKGYPPCTAAACIEILDHFGIDVKGKRVAVVGRSLVVGKPVAIMLLAKHATVTICHTRTVDMASTCKNAEIIIACAGKAGLVGTDCLAEGQVVVDVGINYDAQGNFLGGDVVNEAQEIVAAVTPVPGGVGTVTTSVLVKHVIEAAKKAI